MAGLFCLAACNPSSGFDYSTGAHPTPERFAVTGPASFCVANQPPKAVTGPCPRSDSICAWQWVIGRERTPILPWGKGKGGGRDGKQDDIAAGSQKPSEISQKKGADGHLFGVCSTNSGRPPLGVGDPVLFSIPKQTCPTPLPARAVQRLLLEAMLEQGTAPKFGLRFFARTGFHCFRIGPEATPTPERLLKWDTKRSTNISPFRATAGKHDA